MVFETSLPRVKAFTTKFAKLSSGLCQHGGKRKQSFKFLLKFPPHVHCASMHKRTRTHHKQNVFKKNILSQAWQQHT